MRKLTLNTDIYSDQIIEAAIIAYKELAKITISRSNHQIQLEFTECKFDASITIKEFENYLIGLENS